MLFDRCHTKNRKRPLKQQINISGVKFSWTTLYSKLVASNSSYVRGLSAEEWRFKDINQCVLTGDPECKFVEGEMRDRTTSFDENDLAVVSDDYSSGFFLMYFL